MTISWLFAIKMRVYLSPLHTYLYHFELLDSYFICYISLLLLCILMLKLSQIGPWEPLHADSRVLLIWPSHSLSIFFTFWHSRIFHVLPHLGLESAVSKVPSSFWWRMHLEIKIFGLGVFVCYCVIASRPFHLTQLRTKYYILTYEWIHICLHTYIYVY